MQFNPSSSERRDITYDEVRLVVDKFAHGGTSIESITARDVRPELGDRGSYSTISKHLKRLRGESHAASVITSAPAFSDHLLQALAKELARVAEERTSHLQDTLGGVQGSLDAVVEENDGLRIDLARAEATVESLQRSVAEQAGVQGELRARIKELGEQLVAATKEAESARHMLSLADERHSFCESRCKQLELELSAAHQETRDVRHKFDAASTELAAARSDVRALTVELSSKQNVEADLHESRAQLLEQHRQLGEARQRVSDLEEERGRQEERVAEMKQALARSEAHLQQFLTKTLAGPASPDSASR